jgi:tetratricopeptide (TPR) repeat protein
VCFVRWDLARLSRLPRRHGRLTAAVLLLAGLAALATPHVRAWYHLRAARSDLERFRAAPAQAHLRTCLEVWPSSAQAHRLAARADRLAGAFDDAERHLRECQRLQQPPPEEVVFEWALLRAARGDLGDVEPYLEDRARKSPAEAPPVWEALAQGYRRTYRTLDAVACLDRWLKRQPDSVPALALRGKVWLQGKAAKRALPDLQQAVAGDPADAEARWDLALCLLQAGRFDEAIPHLEQERALRPGDPEVLVHLARCHHMLGRAEQALPILEAVLAEHPGHGLALRTRGQVALSAGSPADAEKWLRQAVEALPYDCQAHWALHRSLLQQEKAPEAKAQLKRAQQVEDQVERLGEITTRAMSERPHDPALHCELGLLLLEMGHKEVGYRWLLSALRLEEGYRPAHAALADYYQAEGDADRAAQHRRQAQ